MNTQDVQSRAQNLVAQEQESLADLRHGYPANHFAWNIVLDAANARNAKSVIEVGVGHGNGIAHCVNAGLRFSGFDNDEACVLASREVGFDLGVTHDQILLADVEQPSSLAKLTDAGTADVLVALGILPSVQNEIASIQTMANLVRPGGEIFVECRNSAFALFTFNRFTANFILDELLQDAPENIRDSVATFIKPRLDMNRPPLPTNGQDPRQHNPFTVSALFEQAGLHDISIHPFHYHSMQPALENDSPAAFRRSSLDLESESSGWKGLFLCSAFLVRASRPL